MPAFLAHGFSHGDHGESWEIKNSHAQMREGPNENEGVAASGFLAGDRGLRRHGARPWKQHKNPKPIARIAVEHRPKLSFWLLPVASMAELVEARSHRKSQKRGAGARPKKNVAINLKK
jgi:hypothetical protein